MGRESTVLKSSNGRLLLGLALALTLLVSFVLTFTAQTEAKAQAGDVQEKAKAAGSAAKVKARAQTSHVNVTTEGSGQTKITVNGQRVEDNQRFTQEDSEGAGASTGGAQADKGSGGTALSDLTCNQLINMGQYAEENGIGNITGQYADLTQNCDIRGGDVIAGTIPDGAELADTGGPSLGLLVASLLLVGGGLLLRATIRR